MMNSWTDMTDEEVVFCRKINNFFCSLHLLVVFADVSCEIINKFVNNYSSTESDTLDDDDDDDGSDGKLR